MTIAPAVKQRSRVSLVLGLLVLLLLCCVVSLGFGLVRFTPLEVLQATFSAQTSLEARVIQELRLPRIVMAVLAGAFFAVSGAMLQGVVRNPLASPDLVGVGAGAGVFAVITLILLPTSPSWLLPVGAFVGAWLAFGLVLWLAQRGGELNPMRLALIGIAVGAALGAVQQLILLRAPDEISRALLFLIGTVYGADWSRVLGLLPWLWLLPVAWVLSHKLDVLAFSDDVSSGLGMRLGLTRVVCMSVAVGLAAAAVSGVGILGFVGLLAPHAARLLVGSSHAVVLPVSALLGAILVVLADALGRGLLTAQELPAGVFTTLLGAPYFLWLMWRTGRLK